MGDEKQDIENARDLVKMVDEECARMNEIGNPFINQFVRTARRRVRTHAQRVASYHRKLKRYQDDPDWVVIVYDDGYEAYHKDSETARKIREEQQLAKFKGENPIEYAMERFLNRDSVTMVEIRAALDTTIGFSPELLKACRDFLVDEGVSIDK